MPAERIAMRLVREILRLIAIERLPVREIARRTGKAPSTVRATLGRCRAAGVSWPLPEGLSDAGLEERLYGKGGAKPGPARRTEEHYDIGILPARRRKPRDKAKVKSCVLIVERYLLGRLRHSTFYSLAELNLAIREMLADVNERRPLRRLGVTRKQLFDELDRPALKPLPAEPYVYAEWRVRRAGLDYHVEVEDHYYSVPYRFAKDELEVHLTARTVEVFRKGERITAHIRNSGNHRHTTIPEHMPSSPRHFADWSIERMPRGLGHRPLHRRLIELILEERRHPEQGFRACLGIVRLAKSFGRERVERPACAPLRSAPAATARSAPSSTTTSIARPPPSAPRTAQRSSTPTSAARATTTERFHAQSSYPYPARGAGSFRHGQGLRELLASGDAAGLSLTQGLGLLLDREASYRRDKRLASRLKYADLRHQAVVEDVDYKHPRKLDRAVFQKLIAGDWIGAHDNLIVCGKTGLGKSWLACALGHKACRDNRSVLYQRVPKLFNVWRSPAATAAMPGFSGRCRGSMCSSWTISASGRSMPSPARTFWKSLKSATAGAPPSSPASRPWTNGMSSSASPPTRMPSSTASSTMPTASSSTARPSAKSAGGPERESEAMARHPKKGHSRDGRGKGHSGGKWHPPHNSIPASSWLRYCVTDED